MAIKIVAIICGVSWAIFGISFLFTNPATGPSDTGGLLWVIGWLGGFISLIGLAILALIDYARRPR